MRNNRVISLGAPKMRREFETGVGGVHLGPSAFSPVVRAPAAKPAPRAPALSRFRQLTVYGISLGIWGSGALWLVLHYFFEQEGQFGPAPHPLEFWSIAAHGAFGFATLWLLGLLWSVHVPAGWRSLRRRWSGSIMFGCAGFLVVTGYLLYYLGNVDMIPIVAMLHWGIGLACPALFLLHRFARDPQSERARR